MTTNQNILIYQNDNENIKVDVKPEDEILLLSQAQIYGVFGKVKSTIINFIVIVSYFNTLSDDKELSIYNSLNTPLPPLCNVPKKGFSS